jgi:hypothetical protein
MPDVISHVDAVKMVIALPKPTWVNHPPSPIGNNLSSTNALVFEPPRKRVFIGAHDRYSRPHYFTGSSSGLVTGPGLVGALLGGGGLTGSAVGDTGSSRGMTVYLLTGSPICPTADLPLVEWRIKSVPPPSNIRQLGRSGVAPSAAVVMSHANGRGRVPTSLARYGRTMGTSLADRCSHELNRILLHGAAIFE